MNNTTYSTLVESLKRLYNKEIISKAKVNNLLKENKITTEEHLYILGEDGEE